MVYSCNACGTDGCGLEPCGYMICSAAMLTSVQSGGVRPEVNLRQKSMQGSTLVLKPRVHITRSPKQGYQWPHKKDLSPFTKNLIQDRIDISFIGNNGNIDLNLYHQDLMLSSRN